MKQKLGKTRDPTRRKSTYVGVLPGHQTERAGGGGTHARDENWVKDDTRPTHVLLDALHAPAASRLGALRELLLRLDDASHLLLWAAEGAPPPAARAAQIDTRASPDVHAAAAAAAAPPAELALVELPRLRLSFDAKRVTAAGERGERGGGEGGGGKGRDGDEVRLYCREHSGFFLCAGIDSLLGGGGERGGQGAQKTDVDGQRASVEALLCGLPHGVLLQSGVDELAVLLGATAKPRVTAADDASSVEGGAEGGQVVLDRADEHWLANLAQARHYVYPVHPSRALLCASTLASSLCLMLFYFLEGGHRGAAVGRRVDHRHHPLGRGAAAVGGARPRRLRRLGRGARRPAARLAARARHPAGGGAVGGRALARAVRAPPRRPPRRVRLSKDEEMDALEWFLREEHIERLDADHLSAIREYAKLLTPATDPSGGGYVLSMPAPPESAAKLGHWFDEAPLLEPWKEVVEDERAKHTKQLELFQPITAERLGALERITEILDKGRVGGASSRSTTCCSAAPRSRSPTTTTARSSPR